MALAKPRGRGCPSSEEVPGARRCPAGVGPREAPRTSSMGKWDFLAPRRALSEVTSSVRHTSLRCHLRPREVRRRTQFKLHPESASSPAFRSPPLGNTKLEPLAPAWQVSEGRASSIGPHPVPAHQPFYPHPRTASLGAVKQLHIESEGRTEARRNPECGLRTIPGLYSQVSFTQVTSLLQHSLDGREGAKETGDHPMPRGFAPLETQPLRFSPGRGHQALPTPRARRQEGPECLSPPPTSPAPRPSAAVPRLLTPPPGGGGYAPRLRDPRPCQIPGKPQRTAPYAGLPDRPCARGRSLFPL